MYVYVYEYVCEYVFVYVRVFDKIFSLDQIGSGQAMGEPLYF